VDGEDFIAWHYDNKGLFSVKSAYHVLEDEEQMKKQKQQGESNIGSRTSDANAVFWKKLWRLQCPPTVRRFLWRLAQNSLALKMNIKRRRIDLETRCPTCMRFDEDGGDCFLKCKTCKRILA